MRRDGLPLRTTAAIVAAFMTLVASGCVTATTATPTAAASPAVTHRAPRVVDPNALHVKEPQFHEGPYAYYDGATGEQISFDVVIARARAARVVVVGEQHDQATHHELQRRVVTTLGSEPGLVVGLEMLTWPAQPALDRFSRGEIAPEELAQAVDWEKAWGFPFALYEPIFADGRSAGARFRALNPPRELVRALRKKGLDGLSPAERAQLPELDLSDALHRAWFEGIFKQGHPISQLDLNGFYLAQVLWDESMADGASRALDGGARQVVVLCGVGHVAQGRGVPQRIERRRPGETVFSIVPLGEISRADVQRRVVQAIILGEGDVLVVPRFDDEIVL